MVLLEVRSACWHHAGPPDLTPLLFLEVVGCCLAILSPMKRYLVIGMTLLKNYLSIFYKHITTATYLVCLFSWMFISLFLTELDGLLTTTYQFLSIILSSEVLFNIYIFNLLPGSPPKYSMYE